MKPLNERQQAVLILEKLLKNKVSLSQSFQQAGELHSPQLGFRQGALERGERECNAAENLSTKSLSPWCKAICFGVCRHYFRLQAVSSQLMPKPQKSLMVSVVILVGLYQLLYSEKPSYAVVKEMVDILPRVQQAWAKGFVNAILRRACREREAILAQLTQNEAFLYGHPSWLLKVLQTDWPLHWLAIAQANDTPPPMSLRVNLTKISRAAYVEKLILAGFSTELHQYSGAGLTVWPACSVQELPDFAAGEVSLQDEAAQLAMSLLDLAPGLRVLDACAAPGGKTCHLLESEPELRECVAVDISASRLKQIRENLTRLQLDATLKQGDAALPSSWWDGELFDRILLDAPCSAIGVIRRHPDIKLLRTPEELEQVVLMQRKLLHNLWPLLKTGGVLVYATCSVTLRENEQQVAAFIAEQGDCQLLAEDKPWGHFTGHGWQILPGEGNRDGFFYSVLKKI